MAHVQRLILAVLLLWAGGAAASFPTQPVGDTVFGASDKAACKAYAGGASLQGVDCVTTSIAWSFCAAGQQPATSSCFALRKAAAAASENYLIRAASNRCPANSTLSGGSCTCAVGYAEFSGNSCIVDNGCLTTLGMTPPNDGACVGGNCQYGYKVSSGEAATASAYGRFCSNGCTVKGSLDFCGQYSSGVMIAGQGVCQISKSFYTGDKCTGSGAVNGPSSQGTTGGTTTDPGTVKTEANPVPARLDPGKCPGQVNGVDIPGGVNCGSTASNDTTVKNGTTTNPDGSVSNNSTTNNTTIKNTICNAGACTTTTTVTSGGTGPNGTGAGSTTATTTESGPKAEVCAKDPGNTACKGDDDKKPTGFGGSCVGGYKAVSEDAVLNAMAEEQYRRNCQLFDTASGESQTYATEAAKTGDQTGSLAGNATQDLGTVVDTTDALGGGSCPADQTISIPLGGGRTFSFVMAISRSCQGLQWLGVAMLAATAIGCAFIVFKD